MLKDLYDLTERALSIVNKNPHPHDTEEWKEWFNQDPDTLELRRLMDVYNEALSNAELQGFVGVGCIAYAEEKLKEAQK